MIPTHIHIGHYRALRNIGVPLSDYTAMVGPNGVGKSTVLDALDFFFTPSRRVDDGDFQYGADDPVAIAVTLTGLNAEEREWYADQLDEAGYLTVTKSVTVDGIARYEILGSRHRGFDELRETFAASKKSDFTNAYKVFISEHSEYGLKVLRSADDNTLELRRWESEHPEACEIGPVPFTFAGSSRDQLIPSTRIVYVPAVQHASDALDGARSPLTQMLNALIYPRFEANEDFLKLKERVRSEYERLFPIAGTPELEGLSNQITEALETFCPGASIQLGWSAYEPPLSVPPVRPEIVEDGVPTDVDHKGHGLQRALIIAMLQAENEHRRTTDGDSGNVHVVLLIEEPELYQHPTQSRHFRRVLSNLASEATGIRVLVTTHSPDFISIEGIDSIRILRRGLAAKGVPPRALFSVSLEDVGTLYSDALGKPIDRQQLLRQLHVVDNVMREAFFANAAVLVEGEGDRGLISAQCALEGMDLEGRGIVVTPCGGKSNMTLPICILQCLGIKHYAVFDSDRDPTQNRPLLRALGMPDKRIPRDDTPPTGVFALYAILKPTVEDVVRDSVGSVAFDKATNRVANEFARTPDQTLKNPVTSERVLATLRDAGLVSDTLHQIAVKIANL